MLRRHNNRGRDGPNAPRHRHCPQGRTRTPYLTKAGTRNRALRDQQQAGPHHPLLHGRTTAIIPTFAIQPAKRRQTPARLRPANCSENNSRAPSRPLKRRDYKLARRRRDRRAVDIEQSQRPCRSKKGPPPATQRRQVSLGSSGSADRAGSAELVSLDPRYFDWVFVGRSGGCFAGLPKLATGVSIPSSLWSFQERCEYATKSMARGAWRVFFMLCSCLFVPVLFCSCSCSMFHVPCSMFHVPCSMFHVPCSPPCDRGRFRPINMSSGGPMPRFNEAALCTPKISGVTELSAEPAQTAPNCIRLRPERVKFSGCLPLR